MNGGWIEAPKDRESAKGTIKWWKALSPLRKTKATREEKDKAKAARDVMDLVEKIAETSDFLFQNVNGQRSISFKNTTGHDFAYFACFVELINEGDVVGTVLAESKGVSEKKEFISLAIDTDKEITGVRVLPKEAYFRLTKVGFMSGMKEALSAMNQVYDYEHNMTDIEAAKLLWKESREQRKKK